MQQSFVCEWGSWDWVWVCVREDKISDWSKLKQIVDDILKCI